MPLTKMDLKDALLLLKAGNIDAAREILSSSNDPRAVALLTKLDARVPREASTENTAEDELSEVKRLIAKKKFDAAEALLRDSNHPKAKRILQKVLTMKAAANSTETAKPRARGKSLWTYVTVVLSTLRSSN